MGVVSRRKRTDDLNKTIQLSTRLQALVILRAVQNRFFRTDTKLEQPKMQTKRNNTKSGCWLQKRDETIRNFGCRNWNRYETLQYFRRQYRNRNEAKRFVYRNFSPKFVFKTAFRPRFSDISVIWMTRRNGSNSRTAKNVTKIRRCKIQAAENPTELKWHKIEVVTN